MSASARCRPRRPARRAAMAGFTLVEMILALAIAALVVAALGEVVSSSLEAREHARERGELVRQARFAMDRMTRAVSGGQWLVLPRRENPLTAWSEATRDPGVLAVTLDPALDRDNDGYADSDNDKDGRIDEDPPADMNDDRKPGVKGIDDDNDGTVDEGSEADDDEDGTINEDRADGLDNDIDGAIDEDPKADSSGDGAPGLPAVDDDGDGYVDEGEIDDDDEDGTKDEDWVDLVVYFKCGTKLKERMPNIDPQDGEDYTERTIAENVTRFAVTRLPRLATERAERVEITLELTGATTGVVTLATRVRVGSRP